MKKGIRLIAEESEVLETELDEDFWDAWDDRFETEAVDDEDGSNSGDSDTDEDHDEEDDETELEVVGLENDQRALKAPGASVQGALSAVLGTV